MKTSDNEHTALRRRMEASLGRRLSDAAWEVASQRRYVSEALDPAYDDGVENLAAFLNDLLRVSDAGLGRRANRSVARQALAPPAAADLRARIQAVSRLAAEHAAGDRQILRFRRRVLGRDTPMGSNEAVDYLERPETRGFRADGRSSMRRLERFDYQNARIYHSYHVEQGSPVDKLRKLAVSLSKSYPWQPAQAAAFVLEGAIPTATSAMLRLQQTASDERPARSRLVMEVDLWMPAGQVLRAYRRVQRDVLPGHKRPVSRRSIDLVNFVIQRRPATWPQLLQAWNNEHPDQAYADYRSMRYAYDRASKSLLHPRYRLTGLA